MKVNTKKLSLLSAFSLIACSCIAGGAFALANVNAYAEENAPTLGTSKFSVSSDEESILLVTPIDAAAEEMAKVYEVGYTFDGDQPTTVQASTTNYYTQLAIGEKTPVTAADLFGDSYTATTPMIIWEIENNAAETYTATAYYKQGTLVDGQLWADYNGVEDVAVEGTEKTAKLYTVTFTASNGGTVNEDSITVPHGTAMSVEGNVVTIGDTTVTATATVTGSYATYEFNGFTGVTETVAADTTVKANFKANTYLATDSTLVWANFSGLDYSVVSMEGLKSHGDADISKKPVGAKDDYTSVISITPKDWAFNVGFDITDILANIDQYNNHYLTLYVASYFYANVATGAYLTTLNGTGEYVWGSGNANTSSLIPLTNFTAGSTAGWVALNIEMSAIKEMAQTNQGKNYIVYNFAPNKGTPVYIYSLEVTEKVTITAIEGYLPDSTCYYSAAKDGNTIKTVSMAGLTSHGGADISNKPANAKANYNACLSVTPGANAWETAIGFDITDILANIDQYEGKYLTLFAASYFYGARGAYLSGFNASENKVVGISQTEYATGGMAFECASGSTGGWKEYKIPVSALKTAAQNKAGANYITWHFRTNENTPVYVYSLEITD